MYFSLKRSYDISNLAYGIQSTMVMDKVLGNLVNEDGNIQDFVEKLQ